MGVTCILLSNSPQETLYSPTQNFERTIILLDDFCAECEVFRQTEIFVSQKITNIIFFADFINKFYFSLASNVIILQNKENAMQILASKLLAIKQAEHEKKLAELKGENVDINFGSQIRSYVFHPYKMVKDHRTNYEVGNVDAVMDGDLDGFIEAYLRNN